MQLFIEHEETLAREAWKQDALDLIVQLAKTGREFTSDDLYKSGLGPAPHPNMVGPLFYRAMNLGYIIPTHQVRRSQRKARRHGWVAEYRGARRPPAAHGSAGRGGPADEPVHGPSDAPHR